MTTKIPVKMSNAVRTVLRFISEGTYPEMRVVGETKLWFLNGKNLLENGKSVTRAVNSLIHRGFVDLKDRARDGATEVRINTAGKELLEQFREAAR